MSRPWPGKSPPQSSFDDALLLLGTLGLALLLWEALARSGLYPPHLFPPPTRVLRALRQMAASGELGLDLQASGRRWLLGFLCGSLAGVGLGLLTGTVPLLRKSAGSLFNLLRTIPFVVLIPLAILWFGLGETEKVLLVAWGTAFPVWLNTQSGVAGVEREYLWAARCLGARGPRLCWEVHLPRALPFILTGLRVSIATATFALTAAEMAGAFEGVAYRVFYSHQMFQTEKMMAGIVVIALLGLALDRAFVLLARRAVPWWQEADDAS